jgi:hypothetical protein
MKKIIIFLTLTHLFYTINSSAWSQSLDNNNSQEENILKIGVLLPLSGEFKDVGESFLKSIQLALYDISNKNIKIYPRDSRGNALTAYQEARKFQEIGIKIVIGPIFHKSLEKLGELNNITFISLTNRVQNIPENTISFGININSQINTIKDYLIKNKISKTLLLSPKSEFTNQTQIIKESGFNYHKSFLYDTNPKKITAEIEKITNYQERKKDLERRILILEKSDLYKDKKELEKLQQKHTLGGVNFDSVIVVDFGERLKSVLTSFTFSDVTSNDVKFFTINQWFDKTFFNENALQELYFPSINLKNLIKFNNKFEKEFNTKPNKVSIIAYDALGLIYYCWSNNDFRFNADQLYNKKGFKGLHGKFFIKDNLTYQDLKIYKVSKSKFIKVY